MGDHSLAVSGKNILNPRHQSADFGVNAWLVWLSATIAPRDNTLQDSVAHQRTAGVTLSRARRKNSLVSALFHHVHFFFPFYM